MTTFTLTLKTKNMYLCKPQKTSIFSAYIFNKPNNIHLTFIYTAHYK